MRIAGRCLHDGSSVVCVGAIDELLEVGGRDMSLSFIVVEQLIDGVDADLGMDVVRRFRGVYVGGENSISFLRADGDCVSADGACVNPNGACVV